MMTYSKSMLISSGFLISLIGFSLSIRADEINTRQQSWSLLLPSNEMVTYQETINPDDSGINSGPMMYPAPNVAGLLAAMITHGLIIDSAKKNKDSQLQLEANKLLVPYQNVLNNFKTKDLMQQSLIKTQSTGDKKIINTAEKSGMDWLVSSAPVYSLTQDQSAIVLNNVISIVKPETSATKKYQINIKVISTSVNETDPVSFWTKNDGEKLKDESASLLAQSIDLALADASKSNLTTPIYKTIRYTEGKLEKIERGQIIDISCDHQVIRTLRGNIILASFNNSLQSSDSNIEACKLAKQ